MRQPAGVDHQLSVERWGSDGPSVVLLHGIGGSARYWHGVARHGDGYRATAPDLLGFGGSPRPPGSAYDVDEHLALLVPLVPPGSVVVAHSTGAVLAAALAVRRPDLVTALLLVGAPLYADVPEARREVRQLGLLARVTADGELLGRLTMVALHLLVQPLSRWLPLGLPRAVVEDFWKHSWRSYARTLRRVVVEHPAVPDLAQVTVPCTLLYGADDRSAARTALPDLLRRNPLLRAVEVPGTHHLPARQPARVAAALREVLAHTTSDRLPSAATHQEEPVNQPAQMPEIDAAEAARLAEAGDVLLLDVREDDEWQAGHAPQAVHHPLGSLDASALPDDRPVVAVCRSGNRSGRAAQALLAAGRDARNLTGGMQAWASQGLPVVAPDGSAGHVA